MAMNALKNLNNHIPEWQKRLDDLSSQVDRRQVELAAATAADPKGAETRSLRNTGSTESLKPHDEGPLQPTDTGFPPSPLIHESTRPAATEAKDPITPSQDAQMHQGSSPSPSGGHKNAREAMAVVHSRAQAIARKRQRSASMISGDIAPPTYRTRSMIIVYYDSYVQTFFDDLVRYISSSRNLLRKAKMAAKVAKIKRMAEMDVDGEDDDGDDKGEPSFPSLRYMSTPGLRKMGGLSGSDESPDIYDTLDKSLEVIQSTCEHGAHQFLRDADCSEEIQKIRKRIEEVLEMARKEEERIEREEPELAKETGEIGKARTRKAISMRRDLSSPQKEGPLQARENPFARTASDQGSAILTPIQSAGALEVDTDMDVDEGIEVDQELSRLQYRSTRHLRPR